MYLNKSNVGYRSHNIRVEGGPPSEHCYWALAVSNLNALLVARRLSVSLLIDKIGWRAWSTSRVKMATSVPSPQFLNSYLHHRYPPRNRRPSHRLIDDHRDIWQLYGNRPSYEDTGTYDFHETQWNDILPVLLFLLFTELHWSNIFFYFLSMFTYHTERWRRNGRCHNRNPLFAMLSLRQHGHRLLSAYQSRYLSLPAQPEENWLKTLVNAPILFLCDNN